MEFARPGIDRPLRVVAYTDAVGVGGAEISLGHLVAAVSSDIEVMVLGTCQQVVNRIAAGRPQASCMVLPAIGRKMAITHLNALLKLRPDVVHVNLCTPWAGATGLAAALILPGARVVRVDQLPLRTTEILKLWRTRSLCLRVDAHVAVGQASARRMEDFYALGRNTVLSVPNCVPDIEGDPAPPPERPPGQLVVGSVGRLDRMKGHDILLQAIARVDGVVVTILGEGEERPALEQLAAELGVSDRVHLPGWVEEPRNHLSSFDVIAMPSRSEGFPLAIVEAMLAARPVVAAQVGSISEAVVDGKTGLLIDKDDVDGLAAVLHRLRDDPCLRARLGQNGREVARTCFTVQHMAASYEQIWYKVIALPQAPRLRVPCPRP